MAEARDLPTEARHRRLAPNGSKRLARGLLAAGNSKLAFDGAKSALPQPEAAEAMMRKLVPESSPALVGYREAVSRCRAALDK